MDVVYIVLERGYGGSKRIVRVFDTKLKAQQCVQYNSEHSNTEYIIEKWTVA